MIHNIVQYMKIILIAIHFCLMIYTLTAVWCNIPIYPMLSADSDFWLVNNCEIWTRISRLMSSAWDIKRKERQWWHHNRDSDRPPLYLPLQCDRVIILYLYRDLGQINGIDWILKLRKCFRMSKTSFDHGINSLPLVCFSGIYPHLALKYQPWPSVLRCCVWINSHIHRSKQG